MKLNSRFVVVCNELSYDQLHELEAVIEAHVQKMKGSKFGFAQIVVREQ